jgi:bleomycin hydrolase
MMKKQILLLIFTALIFGGIQAQNVEKGKLDRQTIHKIMASYHHNASDKALQNAITHNDIKKLAKNRSNEGKVNHFFNHQVTGVRATTNQKSSGRCWLFTSLNTLRPIVIRKYNLPDFEFSENYCFFWDQFEKANLFMEIAISTANDPMDSRMVSWLFHNPIGDGGQWATFNDLVKKYGLVPASAMPETYQTNHTATLSRLLRRKLREDGLELRKMVQEKRSAKQITQRKIEMLTGIYRMLVLAFGEPPQHFTWQYRDKENKISQPESFTPQSFFKKAVGVNVDDYVMFMNDPTRPYYKLYDVQFDRNLAEGGNWRYINLPNDTIKKFAIRSIEDNQAMYLSCDVGKQFDGKAGFLDTRLYDYDDLFGVKFGMDKTQRIKTFDSGSTHGMALVGVNVLPDGKPDKWLIENSWGANRGHHGFLTATDDWFDNYMFRLVINKKYISPNILKILKSKPILLPPWDPVFTPEP